jgi:hypothetical protein
MKNQIEKILNDTLPKGFNIIVTEHKWTLGNNIYLNIMLSPNNHEMNNVRNQFPQLVALSLTLNTLELEVSHIGGMGGRSVNIKPQQNKHLYCESIKIPFRKPQPNEKSVLNAIQKFAQNYVKILKDNKDILMFQNIVDYSNL